MAKWVKQTYKIKTENGWDEVEGSVCGAWGIDKRDRYYLTYIPNGGLTESARTMKFLKLLVDTPEFQCYNGSEDGTKKLAETIGRYRNEMGWDA